MGDLASLKKELDSTKDELSVVKTALTGLFLILVILVAGLAFVPLQLPPRFAEPATLVTLSETNATYEQCADTLASMFAFFPATRSMMVQYDNSNTEIPRFMVFEVEALWRHSCDFLTLAP